jgi:hypothetical protein
VEAVEAVVDQRLVKQEVLVVVEELTLALVVLEQQIKDMPVELLDLVETLTPVLEVVRVQ